MLTAMMMMGLATADEISAEAFLQVSPSGALTSGLGARLDSGGAFVSLEGRGETDGVWVGRATGGLDLFGSTERIDLTLGVFVGTTGSATTPAVEAAGTAGFELGLGGNLGPIRARYRHSNGFRGALATHLREDEFRLGYRALGTVEVFGQYIRFSPSELDVIDGYGAGLKVAF